METYEKASKRFRIESFTSRNRGRKRRPRSSTPIDTHSDREQIKKSGHNSIASLSTPNRIENGQSSKGCISGEEKLAHDKVIATTTRPKAPATDMLQCHTLIATSQNAPQEQLTPQLNQKQQQSHQQLGRHTKTVASVLGKGSIGEESWEPRRNCQQHFSIAFDGLSRHEVQCPVKIQVRQIISPGTKLQQLIQQEPHNELQHYQPEEQVQLLLWQQSLGSYLPTQDVKSSPQAQMSRTGQGLDLASQQDDINASSHASINMLPKTSKPSQLWWPLIPNQSRTSQNISDSRSLPTFAPDAQRWQQQQPNLGISISSTPNHSRIFETQHPFQTPPFPPEYYDWSTPWTPNHSRAVVPQWQQQPNQEQPFGTPPFAPVCYDGSPYHPCAWAPNHSRAVAPQAAQQLPQQPNQEQPFGTPSGV